MVFRTLAEDVLIDSGHNANLRSYYAEEAVLAGQVVKLGTTNDEAVEPSDTDGELVVGVALTDAAAGEQVTVARDGCKVRATSATGTVAGGELVASHGATGEEGEVDSATTADYYLGIAVADDDGANDDVLVEINIGGPV